MPVPEDYNNVFVGQLTDDTTIGSYSFNNNVVIGKLQDIG